GAQIIVRQGLASNRSCLPANGKRVVERINCGSYFAKPHINPADVVKHSYGVETVSGGQVDSFCFSYFRDGLPAALRGSLLLQPQPLPVKVPGGRAIPISLRRGAPLLDTNGV